MKSILFVCSANKDRSKTAEDYFSAIYSDLCFDSAGTNKNTCNKLGANYISKEQLDLADEVFVMENKHLKTIKELFGIKYYDKISVLNINDIYKYGSKELWQRLFYITAN
ncbi:cellular communication/signal transduction [Algibacter lectus]|uniref:Cellular communication/signal transduction n=1 Tax=Algibacter lectus TaxID=221126 RepID=A0A090WM94_9FLAO|nr:phosphotyrosine protein phosphatase [Algibacter lectus]GAL77338.1 cellular communication/signal transduction [Algibacter lectus]